MAADRRRTSVPRGAGMITPYGPWMTFGGEPITGKLRPSFVVHADPPSLTMSAEQQGFVRNAYAKFCTGIATSCIPNGYHSREYSAADGTRVRTESINGAHRVQAWISGGVKTGGDIEYWGELWFGSASGNDGPTLPFVLDKNLTKLTPLANSFLIGRTTYVYGRDFYRTWRTTRTSFWEHGGEAAIFRNYEQLGRGVHQGGTIHGTSWFGGTGALHIGGDDYNRNIYTLTGGSVLENPPREELTTRLFRFSSRPLQEAGRLMWKGDSRRIIWPPLPPLRPVRNEFAQLGQPGIGLRKGFFVIGGEFIGVHPTLHATFPGMIYARFLPTGEVTPTNRVLFMPLEAPPEARFVRMGQDGIHFFRMHHRLQSGGGSEHTLWWSLPGYDQTLHGWVSRLPATPVHHLAVTGMQVAPFRVRTTAEKLLRDAGLGHLPGSSMNIYGINRSTIDTDEPPILPTGGALP